MQGFNPIYKAGNYELQSYYLGYGDDPKKYFRIKRIQISPNNQLLAIIAICTWVSPSSNYETYDYFFTIIDMMTNEKKVDSKRFKSDPGFLIFSQFTKDSKYFVSHSNQTLNIMNLDLYQSDEQKITSVLSITDTNEIILMNQGNLLIFNMENKLSSQLFPSFKKVSYIISLSKLSNNFYFRYQYGFITFFNKDNNQKQIYQYKPKKNLTSYDYIYVLNNYFIIGHYNYDSINQVHLRILKNFKILRKVALTTTQQNLIQQKSIFCIAKVIKTIGKISTFARFNLVLGLQKKMKFKIQKAHKETYLTNNALVDIQLRYFVYNIE